MSKMLPRYGNEIDQALVVLHAVNELGGCTSLQIIDFMALNDIMPFLDLQFALQTLANAGNICRVQHPAGPMYVMTDAGRDMLRMYAMRARSSVMERISEIAPSWKERFRAERSLLTHVESQPTGEIGVDMRIVEKDVVVMGLHVGMPNHVMAERCAANFKKRAAEIYASVMEILGREGDE